MLNEYLAALNRFISRSTDKCKPFFQALKKNGADFRWNEECEIAFQGLKRYLTSPPPTFKAVFGRDTTPLPRRLGVSCEWGPSSGRQGSSEAGVLRQSLHEWSTNQIPKAREADACFLRHLEKTQALLSNLSDHSPH